MSIYENHPCHIVNKRPWPLTGAVGLIVTLIGLIKWFWLFIRNWPVLTIIHWRLDVTREGTYQGLHTKIVMKGLQWGIILFIVSEILFFVSFFWAFFHSRLSLFMHSISMPYAGKSWIKLSITEFTFILLRKIHKMFQVRAVLTHWEWGF